MELKNAGDVYYSLVNAETLCAEFTRTPTYKEMMSFIDDTVTAFKKASGALNALEEQGVVGFIMAVQQDEDEKVRQKEERIRLLLDNNSKEQRAINEAKAEFDANKPDILEIIQKNDNKIAELEEDNERKVMWLDYQNKKTEHEKQKSLVHTLEHTLDTMQEMFDKGIIEVKDKVAIWRNFLPRITRVEAKASTNAIKDHKPIFMSVTAEYKGTTKAPPRTSP